MKYTARKPFLYGNKIYMAGEGVPVEGDDVKMLQGQGKLGAPFVEKTEVEKVETMTMKPIETAMKPKAEPKHVGGGWYELPDGRRVRKSELEE